MCAKVASACVCLYMPASSLSVRLLVCFSVCLDVRSVMHCIAVYCVVFYVVSAMQAMHAMYVLNATHAKYVTHMMSGVYVRMLRTCTA